MDPLIKQQAALSGYITRMWTNLQKLGQSKITVLEVKSRLERLEDYWRQFQSTHFQLLAFEELVAHEYHTKDLFTVTEENYFHVRNKFLTALGSAPTREQKIETPNPSSPLIRQMQLPKIELPKFSGDQLTWETFRDLFRSMVHDVPGIPPVQKLQHLRNSLTGEAAGVVEGLPITDDDYQGAWDELVKQYDNQRILLFAHMRHVLSCPSASKSSPSEIKRLLATLSQSIRAFKKLKRPVEHWDDWFVHLVVSKLDSHTRLLWETSLADSRLIPTFQQLQDFLDNRVRALEAANSEATVSRSVSTSNSKPAKSRVSANAASTTRTKGKNKCALCQDAHGLPHCAKYKAMTAPQRDQQVKKLGACRNCLRAGHHADACATTGRCLVCADKHHTTLHGAQSQYAGHQQPAGQLETSTPTTSLSNSVSSLVSRPAGTILLATAQVILQGEHGESVQIRALLDSGSEATFVSERVVQELHAARKRVNVAVTGLRGTLMGTVTSSVSLTVRSPVNHGLNLQTEALVLKSLTGMLPARRVMSPPWTHLQGLSLADPSFNVPARVDAILGANVYGQILQPDVRHGAPGTPTALLTVFGWVLTGALETGDSDPVTSHRISVHHAQPVDDLSSTLQRFWEVEEISSQTLRAPDEVWAEEHFRITHTRDESGRYTVRLPLRVDEKTRLGASRPAALSMLLSSERRLSRQPDLHKRYTDFMVEYLALDHMNPVGKESSVPRDSYYLPHHAVFKSNNSTGKIRVVFNASFRTTSGLSLNDCLLPGPRLQADLWLILTRWRLYRIGFMADIVKMFRQIRIHSEDANLQRILWRANPSEEVRDYCLTTVTYGTTSAPFLALRTLQQLTQDESSRFPLGAAALHRHSYVDDILAGGDSPEQTTAVQEQLISLLQAGGFALSKWASNWKGLGRHSDQQERLLPAGEAVGALGIIWNPQSDTLALKVTGPPDWPGSDVLTKRRALSEAARLFDPLGWAAPVLIFAKVFLQDLWLAGCNWDDPLPTELSNSWADFRASVRQLNEVRIPRWVAAGATGSVVELHGFSDASARAYAAAVYLRVVRSDEDSEAHLLLAKTKVAPVKTQSIPRLELCGAVLLARLMTCVAAGLEIEASSLYAWTDAQVVLSWLRSHASRWKPFVAHRVAEVQTLLPSDRWSHVETASNPADLATRGISPDGLLNRDLWWRGPDWLRRPSSSWPVQRVHDFPCPPEEEQRTKNAALHASPAVPGEAYSILERFSSLTRLLRVTAYCFRFSSNARKAKSARGGFLTSDELLRSRQVWIRQVQHREYAEELRALRSGRPISVNSSLRSLQPILDETGLLRVGGRVQSAVLPYSERHPLILPKEGHFTLLVIRHAHTAALHGGPQLMRSYILRSFWIIGGNSKIRQVFRQCVRCARFRAETGQQRIGQLPPERVRPTRPFLSTGVDYAGPLRIRASKGRGHQARKGYICLFVCLATKAIHLEAVSDLTTTAFIAAFRRFTSRRGRSALLMSDNGTNFRGADVELKKMFRGASTFQTEVASSLANDGTSWRFIPPHAPHFGGLWEAGVRSVKYHLRRLLGDHALTYEELNTLLCQIEACLNSRPLGPLSAEPDDLVALTPGHFLVGEPLTNLPEPISLGQPSTLLTRWQLVSNIRNHFWHRWSREYIHRLQQATKWQRQKVNFKVGDLVLVQDGLHPPAKWPLGRVVEVSLGPDGLVRVTKVRTARTVLTRPITRLCRLPVENISHPPDDHLIAKATPK